ncbi:MAG: glycosyltransferase family 4 protein [Candidatus Helarchaeota archaeon]|nr:glycosyltransferase family 4 protein [Candidatus Helarchaeota archaeon]
MKDSKKLTIIHLQATSFGKYMYKSFSKKDFGISLMGYQPYLCEEQGKLGHKVVGILFSKDGKSFIIEKRKNYVFYFLPSLFQLPFPLNKIYKEPLNFGIFFQILKIKPDIVHLHGLFTYHLLHLFLIPLLKIKGIKVFSHLRGLDPVNPFKKPVFFFFYFVQFLLCRFSNKILCLNKKAGYLLQKFKLCKKNKVEIMPNGINIDLFKPKDKASCIKKLNLDPNFRYILLVNRIALPQKDPFTVLESIKDYVLKNKDIKLVIIGDGPDLPKLKKKIKEYNLMNKVIHYKFVTHDKMPLFYNVADCFILHSKFEGMPKVVLEAFATKTPVIASNIHSIRYLVKHKKNGILVEFQNKNQILKAVKMIFSDDKLRDNIVTNAFNFIQDFTWEKISYNLIKLYRKELKK